MDYMQRCRLYVAAAWIAVRKEDILRHGGADGRLHMKILAPPI